MNKKAEGNGLDYSIPCVSTSNGPTTSFFLAGPIFLSSDSHMKHLKPANRGSFLTEQLDLSPDFRKPSNLVAPQNRCITALLKILRYSDIAQARSKYYA